LPGEEVWIDGLEEDEMNKQAAVVACAGYEEAFIGVKKAIDLLGGAEHFFSKGQKVFIKANLMRKSAPEQACITHPAITAAIAKLAIEAGATVVIGDSPGGVYNPQILKQLYRATGYEKMADEIGAVLNFNCAAKKVEIGGKVIREMNFIQPFFEADIVVNAAKLKTHAHATYTGAAKNMFGCVPGLEKAEMHFNYPGTEDFANALIDISIKTAPVLSIIDGIVAMEGNGPGSGDPRFVGVIIASKDMFAADLAAMEIVGIEKTDVPMMREAEKRGLVAEHIEILGDDIEKLRISDFKRSDFVDNNILRGRVPKVFSGVLSKWLALKAVVDKEGCIGCGVCRDVCPAKTIKIKKGKAKIVRKDCVKCFCCQEFCPKKAISGKRNQVIAAAMAITK